MARQLTVHSNTSLLAKRAGSAAVDEEGVDDLEQGEKEELRDTTKSALRASAIAAVDAAENSLRANDGKNGSGGEGVHILSVLSVVSGLECGVALAAGPAVIADTELAADVGDFPELSAAAREIEMIFLQAAPVPGKSPAVLPIAMSGIESSCGLLIKAAPAAVDIYGESIVSYWFRRVPTVYCD